MSDPITRLNAALEGRYRIERELGEGGMATVYLADDLKHERKVALKVLKPELAAVVGAERFLAEIKTTANLQHPHILPLFDSGEADSFLFYVMPYVEGETLQQRISREKQLPVKEAVRITTAVADALQHAHDRGVIHRDIKPANILMQGGQPVIADFGIALAVGAAGGSRLTETGLSVGTPFYRSPEQATGDQQVGPPSDTYALAAVLYEMLTGDPPYIGSTAQAVLGKIIQGAPVSATEIRKSVPRNVDAAIRKALEKLPADRFASAQEFAKALGDPGFRHGELATEGIAAGVGSWNRLTMAMTGVAALTTLALGWSLLRPEPPEPVARFPSPFEAGQEPMGPAMETTPDGSALVYTGPGPNGAGTQLWIRRWGSLSSTPIPGTEGARAHSLAQIALSPDGREVALVPGEGVPLRVVPLAGGPSRTLVDAAWAAGGWSDDGWVYFQNAGTGIQRVRETGGEPEVLTEPTEGEVLHTIPRLLPDGRGVVFEVFRNLSGVESEVWVVDLETRERTMLVRGNSPRYVSTGHLLFGTDDGRLMAAPFDTKGLTLTGPSVPVGEGLSNAVLRGNITYSISQGGTLVYLAGGRRAAVGGQQLVVVDLDGNEQALVLAPRAIQRVSWSPDGQSVVYSSDGQIYTYNVVLNTTPRQITFEGVKQNPAFSPDGTRVAFQSIGDGTDGYDLFVKNLDDDSPPRSIITLEANQFVTQWPSDSLIVFERGANNNRDLWTVDLADPDSPRAEAYLSSEADLASMVVSPDGTLAAYSSNESGQYEIYIRSFPDPGGLSMVSQDGGRVPFWSPDGNTLYYARDPGVFIAARMERDPVPVVSSIDTLFTTSGIATPFPGSGLRPDGDRFILARSVGTTDTTGDTSEPDRFILVLNFFEELKRLVPN